MLKFVNYIFLAGVIVNLIVLFQRNKTNSKLIATARVLNNDTLKDKKELRKISIITAILIVILFFFIREMVIDFNILKNFAQERSIVVFELFKSSNNDIYKELWTKNYEVEILESVSYLKIKIYYLFSLVTLAFLTIINSRVRIEKEGFRVFKDLYSWENCKGYYWSKKGDLVIVSNEGYPIIKSRFGEEDKIKVEKEIRKILAEI